MKNLSTVAEVYRRANPSGRIDADQLAREAEAAFGFRARDLPRYEPSDDVRYPRPYAALALLIPVSDRSPDST